MKSKFIIVIVLLTLTASLGFAQENSQDNLTDLALEFSTAESTQPVYLQIGRRNGSSSGLPYRILFRGLKSPNRMAKSERNKRIYFRTIRIKNGIKVKVILSELINKKRTRKTVAEYTLNENDEVFVEGLEKFGVKPLKIKLIKATESYDKQPKIINEIPSLLVTKVQTISPLVPSSNSPLSHKITLLNNSDKDIKTIIYRHISRKGASGSGIKGFGKKLFKSGSLKELTIRNFNQLRFPKTPFERFQSTINFSAVIFADNSYEGNQYAAASAIASRISYRIQSKKIIELLEKNKNVELNPANIKLQAEKLDETISKTELTEFISNYPDLSKEEIKRINKTINRGITTVKRKFLFNLDQLINKDFTLDQNWFDQTIESYERRLKRYFQ